MSDRAALNVTALGVGGLDTPARTTVRLGSKPSAGSALWRPKPHFYVTVLSLWAAAVAWFHPRLATLPELGTTLSAKAALWFFVLFIDVAWIYASYNVAVIVFGAWYSYRLRKASSDVGNLPSAPESGRHLCRARLAEGEQQLDTRQPLETNWHVDGNQRLAMPLASVSQYLPPVALLYTTCNDFAEPAVLSCVEQDYPSHRVYILDDGSDPAHHERIEAFAAAHPDRVRVVRRADRRAYKAGNLNHALGGVAREPFFVLIDADEILPADFLKVLIPRMLAQPDCGFIQATHRCNPRTSSSLGRDLGPGVDSHWRWYHPLRNDYGFVMLLGHGALVRRQAWIDAGGFPELVSEDLAFALRAREAGWRGRFAPDVTCYEEFPEDVRAFRVRHMKWTRGTCEFLVRETGRLLRSRRISWVEKVDILLPTLNLPLSFLFFLFVLDANLVLTSLYGNIDRMTWLIAGEEWRVPVLRLDPAFAVLNRADLFLVTLIALVSPVLCFVIDMARYPRRLWGFLAKSTALYGALGPLSSIGVLLFAVTRCAVFHVTADKVNGAAPRTDAEAGFAGTSARVGRPAELAGIAVGVGRPAFTEGPAGTRKGAIFPARVRARLRSFALRSHPDDPLVQFLEIVCGAVLVTLACVTVQLPFLGLALGYLMLPLLHHSRWDSPVVRVLVRLPLALIVLGITLGGLSVFGVQTVFFGYGFHF